MPLVSSPHGGKGSPPETIPRMTRTFSEEKSFSTSFSDTISDDNPSTKTGDIIRQFNIQNYHFSHAQLRMSVEAFHSFKLYETSKKDRPRVSC